MLGWRDLAAAFIVAVAVIVFSSFIGAIAWTAFVDPRLATLALGFAGLGACIVGSVNVTSLRGAYMGSMSTLGGFLAGVSLVGVVFGWSWAPALLMGGIVLMWAMATARHAVTASQPVLRT